MVGRKPKPTALKQLTDNAGHRPLNRHEPKPSGAVIKPKFLKGRASHIWDQYAPQMVGLGLLTPIDAHTFAAWCCLVGEYEKSPEMMTAARIAQMRALAAAFGMESSARSRLAVKTGEPEDDAKKFFESEAIQAPVN